MQTKTLTTMKTAKRRTAPAGTAIYARVSNQNRKKKGFGIPAQLRLLREYAAAKGLVIRHEFVDVETAKVSGRTQFAEMLEYLKKNRASCGTILVEKTDRLYRNIKDYTIIDELDIEVHFVRDNEVISCSGRNSSKPGLGNSGSSR
jgi:site-specific DNA recombinase